MKSKFPEILEELPYGLERVTLRVIEQCSGSEKAIPRRELLTLVRKAPGLNDATDRQLRRAIQNLREEGVRICNLLGGDGYYLAANEKEYQEFRGKYSAYALTIWQTIRSMDERRKAPIMSEADLDEVASRRQSAQQLKLI